MSLFFLILLTTVSCTGPFSKPKSLVKKHDPSFLFVIMSRHGAIEETAKGTYILVLDHNDVDKVLAFSDRPYRLVKNESGEAFKDLWSACPNPFTEDPPNAVVVIDQHLQTLILTSMSIQENRTIFTIQPDGNQPISSMSGVCQLFIDNSQ
ncbi:MAG: hypothetical protein S4CHLAM7_15540 [Chlamydiae bacterium]|nr:hypothetical protein [Chlamydiota bacterium]